MNEVMSEVKTEEIQLKPYCCYLIFDTISQRTYIGISNDFEKRLRQHNGEIKGGLAIPPNIKVTGDPR